MATLFKDEFDSLNGTLLESTGWIKHNQDPAALVEIVDGAVLSSHNGRVFLCPTLADDLNYSVLAVIQTRAADSAGLSGIVGRHRSDINVGYLFGYDDGNWGGVPGGVPGFALRKRYVNQFGNYTDQVQFGIPVPFIGGAQYRIEIKFQCTRVICRVKRLLDDKWLDSDGSWVNGRRNCFDYVDNDFPVAERGHGGLILTNSRPPTQGTVPLSFALQG